MSEETKKVRVGSRSSQGYGSRGCGHRNLVEDMEGDITSLILMLGMLEEISPSRNENSWDKIM